MHNVHGVSGIGVMRLMGKTEAVCRTGHNPNAQMHGQRGSLPQGMRKEGTEMGPVNEFHGHEIGLVQLP